MDASVLEYYVDYDPTGNDQGLYNRIWRADPARRRVRSITGLSPLEGEIGPGGDVASAIKALVHPLEREVDRMQCAPNEYFHRIARPVFGNGMPQNIANWGEGRHLIAAQVGGQLDWLLEELRSICQTVHPSRRTFRVFGHAIRNLLILACTEVEAAWKGVLRSNEYEPDKNKLSTSDYIKLCSAMRLAEYSVQFSAYPWLDEFKPFQSWSSDAASQSLKWYRAYNNTKHDREKQFRRAKLEYAFEAISACAVMLHAQFGGLEGSRAHEFLTIVDKPNWAWSEYYMPGSAEDLVPVNYKF